MMMMFIASELYQSSSFLCCFSQFLLSINLYNNDNDNNNNNNNLFSKRLQLMQAHDSLFLLRNVLTAPRLMHLLRSTLCIDIVRCYRFMTQSFVSLCLQRSILIWMTSVGAKHLCLSGGVVWVSVVLFCWHRLPNWPQPQAPRNSLPSYFLLDSEPSRTAELMLF